MYAATECDRWAEKRWYGEPLWLKTIASQRSHAARHGVPDPADADRGFAPLRSPTTCDVAIVGGGLGGAMLAYELTRARVNVVVVDRGQPGMGATVASTALLQYELDTPLVKLMEMHGAERAMAAYRRYFDALDEIRKLVRRLDDRCGLAKRPSVFMSGPQMNSSELRAECRARGAAGIECGWHDGNSIYQRFGIVCDGAIVSPIALEIDPLRLHRALLRAAVRRGARVYGETDVGGIEPDRQGVTLTSCHGQALRARHAVFANGTEVPYFADASVIRHRTTYALATRPVGPDQAWSEHALFWEAADPYFYGRMTEDDRIVVGGEDYMGIRRVTDADLTLATMKLLAKLRLRVPQVREVTAEHVWSGPWAETTDGLPVVDRSAESHRVCYAMGPGGNGITFGWIAARILASSILAETDPSAPIFRYGRFHERSSSLESNASAPRRAFA
jgi:glycine/D-amino acid oxidase-like deaminating enzyme